MQYLLIIYDDEKKFEENGPKTPEEMNAYMEKWWKLNDALEKAGALVAGDALQPVSTATTVRNRDGKTTFTDGPFAETAEQLGGYYLIEAKDLDEALSWAARVPVAESGCVEVRPIMVLPPRPE